MSKIDLHRLLTSIVVSGIGTNNVFQIECPNKHLIGYSKVPVDQEPQTIVIQCHECDEIAQVGQLLVAAQPSKPARKAQEKPAETKQEAPKKEDLNSLSDEELAVRLEHAPKGSELRKKIISIRAARQLVKTRKIKDDNFLQKMEAMREGVQAQWVAYSADKPKDPAATLRNLLKQNPYKTKTEIKAEVIFMAFWLAWEIWQEDFVNQLTKEWKFPTTTALRGRISSLWTWLDDKLRLKMPFMTKALAAPKQAEEALKKAANKEFQMETPVFTTRESEPEQKKSAG